MTTTATTGEIDAALIELREGAQRWAKLRPEFKADLLRSVREGVYREAARWAHAAAAAKGVDGTPLAGEEWISGPWAMLYAINRCIRTLEEIAESGTPNVPAKRVRERAGGQVVVDVFPRGIYDRLLLSGVRAEVWMQPDVTPATLPDTTAVWY
ncbi:MAG TPA: hypothetical protein VIK27_07405, partial [Candidatus Aquilonibacter sp.]